jgi:CHAT domain-containing protein
LALAGKIDAILKISIVASVLFASSSVGYYYLSYLPRRDARFEPERALEQLRTAAQKRAEQEQLLSAQQASEQRALEQQAAEQRQSLENADRYQACLSHASQSYNESRMAACNRLQEKVIKNHDTCIRSGFREKVCNLAYVVREPSPNCALPQAIASNLDDEAEKARDRCLKESRLGLQ